MSPRRFKRKTSVPRIDVKKFMAKLEIEKVRDELVLLREIHNSFRKTIPIENLNIHYGLSLSLDVQELYRKMVVGNRGGLPLEVNALLYALLFHLGYDCILTSAQLRLNDSYDDEFSHMVVLVKLDDLLVCDVGYIDGCIEPKKIVVDSLQVDYARYFKLEKDPDDFFLLRKSSDAVQFETLYRFEVQEKQLIQFLPRLNYSRESIKSVFKQQKLVSKFFAEGYLRLTDNRFQSLLEGQTQDKVLMNEDEFISVLEQHFNITRRDLLQQDSE